MAVKTAPEKARGKHAVRKPSEKRGFFRRYWWAFVLTPVVAIAAALVTLLYVYSQLQLPPTPPPLQTTYVLDRHGNVIGTFHTSVDRTIIPFAQMPPPLRDAVVAAEDKDFYHHSGIDPVGILRAAWNDLIARKAVQGGSTITQQVVKNVYAGHYETDPATGVTTYVIPPRTFTQKVREVLLAMKLDRTYSKDEILAQYLNTVYFGHGAYGVEAAARRYFSKSAAKLTLVEAATLAGAVQQPVAYDPTRNPKSSQKRRTQVLNRMAEMGFITPAVAREAAAVPTDTRAP